MNEFDKWYSQMFGTVLGSQDEDNKAAVRKIWDSILTCAAEKFEFDDFESYTGQQIGMSLRRMARQAHGTHNI